MSLRKPFAMRNGHRHLHSFAVVSFLLLSLAAPCTGCTGQTPEQSIDATASDSAGDMNATDDAGTTDAADVHGIACENQEALALYEKRIAPLMAEDRVDSCNKCHFEGVELRQYVRETPCATMACMAELDVVDLEQPDARTSKMWECGNVGVMARALTTPSAKLRTGCTFQVTSGTGAAHGAHARG